MLGLGDVWRGALMGCLEAGLGFLEPVRGSLEIGCLGALTGSCLGADGSLLGAVGCLLGADGSLLGAVGCLLGANGSLLGADGSLLGAEGSLLGGEGSLLGADGVWFDPNCCCLEGRLGPLGAVAACSIACILAKSPPSGCLGGRDGTRGGGGLVAGGEVVGGGKLMRFGCLCPVGRVMVTI